METYQPTPPFVLSEQEIEDLCKKYHYLEDPRLIIDAINVCFSHRQNRAKLRLINAIFSNSEFKMSSVYGLKFLAKHLQNVCTGLLNASRYNDYTFQLSVLGKVRVLINYLYEVKKNPNFKPQIINNVQQHSN